MANLSCQGTERHSEPITADEYDSLPDAMRAAKRWLLWRSEPSPKKPRKVPYYVNGRRRAGKVDSTNDWANLADFPIALAALQTGNYTGLGFALGPDGTGNCWQGIDLDGMSERPELSLVAKDLPGYTETSPSGDGMHAIGYGNAFALLGSNSSGLEAYSHGRYFTVTADKSGIHPPVCLADFVDQRLKPMHAGGSCNSESAAQVAAGESVPPETVSELRSALFHIRADDRDLWQRMGHALKTLGVTGRGLWLNWSATSEKFDSADAARMWDSLKPIRTDYRAVFAEAQKRGWVNPLSQVAQGRLSLPDDSGIQLQGGSAEQAVREPLPLPQLPGVPEFPLEVLPDRLDAWIRDAADRARFRPDFAAAVSMVALGSVIGRKIGICLKRYDDWTEYANVWGAMIGPPSALRSPAMRAAMRPLKALQVVADERHTEARAEFAKAAEAFKIRKDAKKKAAAKNWPRM